MLFDPFLLVALFFFLFSLVTLFFYLKEKSLRAHERLTLELLQVQLQKLDETRQEIQAEAQALKVQNAILETRYEEELKASAQKFKVLQEAKAEVSQVRP